MALREPNLTAMEKNVIQAAQAAGHHVPHHSDPLVERIERLEEHVEAVIEELIDLEEYALKHNYCAPPKARNYRIRIDNVKYTVSHSKMTGEQILALAGKSPLKDGLQQKLHGAPKTVKPDQEVDFTAPGIERFMTLPYDQDDGGL